MTFSICVLILASLVYRGYSSFSTSENRPHIIHILVDDLGWAELGYHRHDDEADVNTSFIDELVRTESLELDRFYTHKICSPSRCAIQTGRAPIHVNVQNVKPEVRNENDPIGKCTLECYSRISTLEHHARTQVGIKAFL